MSESGRPCQQWPEMDPPRHNFCRNPGNVEVSPWCLVGPRNERESCGISRCSHVSAGRVLVASCGKDMVQYVSSCLIPRDRAVGGGGGGTRHL